MLIIGSGGLARQNIDTLSENGLLQQAVFYDGVSQDQNTLFMGRFAVMRRMDEARHYFARTDQRFVVLVGGPDNRKRLQEEFVQAGGMPDTLISAKADIGSFDVAIGAGTVIMNKVLVESTVNVGKGVLLNVGVIVTHDTVIGDFCEIGPAAVLCGAVTLEERVFVGTGAIILPGITLGAGAVIGAGAVVTRNVQPGEKVGGVPAKRLT